MYHNIREQILVALVAPTSSGCSSHPKSVFYHSQNLSWSLRTPAHTHISRQIFVFMLLFAPPPPLSPQNWPSCCPFIYHNIREQIPAWNRSMVRFAYLTELVTITAFFYNAIIILATLFAGLPVSYLCVLHTLNTCELCA